MRACGQQAPLLPGFSSQCGLGCTWCVRPRCIKHEPRSPPWVRCTTTRSPAHRETTAAAKATPGEVGVCTILLRTSLNKLAASSYWPRLKCSCALWYKHVMAHCAMLGDAHTFSWSAMNSVALAKLNDQAATHMHTHRHVCKTIDRQNSIAATPARTTPAPQQDAAVGYVPPR